MFHLPKSVWNTRRYTACVMVYELFHVKVSSTVLVSLGTLLA